MIIKRAILFLLFLLTLGLFWMSCNLKGYQTPIIRTGIVHPVYVLGPRKIYDEKLAVQRKPIRFGPMGWLHNGSMVFRTPEDARVYMTRNFHAYPPNKNGVYWASGEFDLDTRKLKNGSYVLNKTLQVEGLADTFTPLKPVQPDLQKPEVEPAPGPTGMGMKETTIPGPTQGTGSGMGMGQLSIPGPTGTGKMDVKIPGPTPSPAPTPAPTPVPAP